MAYFKKRRIYKKKTAARKKPARGGRKSSVSSSVANYVKKQIHRNIEDKCVQINFGQSFGNILESPEFNAFPMCPLSSYWTIPQGVTQGTRLANQIKTRKVYLNYILRPNSWDSTFNTIVRPTYIQMFLGYVKNTPCFAPIPGDLAQLFQSGASSVGPFGNLRDIISVINTDYWVIKKKWIHKLGYANNAGSTGSVAAQQASQFYSNNDFKYSITKKMDITKMLPSTHIFNDSSTSTNTRNLFLMYNAVSADGSTFGSNQLPANIEYWIDFHYEDA